jgi:hypothetical protein
MRFTAAVLFSSLLITTPCVLATDHVWVIGGGPSPGDSQAQIEINVNWVIQVLNNYAGKRQLHVYYSNGRLSGKDVVLWRHPKESKQTLQPLARVFGEEMANGDNYYDHHVPHVIAGTEAGALKARLEKEFSELKPGDRALIVYNGHGLHDRSDAAGNTLRLWNDTQLSVREVDAIMNRIDPKVPVRLVLTQCFSGGFERLVHPHAEDVLALNEANRCGFFAVSKDDEAEGCSASVNIGDYRDYTTFFFAALQGRTRTGEAIPVNPDLDGNGIVSLYEAHLFALSQAHSTDLPRSTSEVFLERWQPWYLRWVDTGAEPDNVYGRLSREVAEKNGLPDSGLALIHAMKARRLALGNKMTDLENEQVSLGLEILDLQKEIKKDLGMRWPEALAPYTLNFVHFLKTDLNAAQDFILSHARYPELVAKQDRRFALDEDLLHVERDIAQLDKILRLRKLARLQNQFERHATAQERAWYQRLMSCEGQGL